jgi:hypothetical protein
MKSEIRQATEPGTTTHQRKQIWGEEFNPDRSDLETRYGGESRGPPFYFDVESGVYVLECENGKYYVGMSNNLENRVTRHFMGDGAMWTEIHTPVCVDAVITANGCRKKYNSVRVAEDKITINYMKTYGTENVRGGSWVHTDMSECPPLPVELRGDNEETDLKNLASKIL